MSSLYLSELALDDAGDLFHHASQGEPGENLAQESHDHQAFRLFPGQPPAHEIEPGLLVQLADRGSVGAFHVIGLDFQIWKGIGPGISREEEVPVGLVRVGLLGTGVTPDDSPEDGTRRFVLSPLVQKVACCVGGQVVLAGIVIEVLGVVPEVETQHV